MCLQNKSFENTVRKKEKLVPRNFSFPPSFPPISKTFWHFHQIKNCCLQALWVWKHLKFVIWEMVKTCTSSMFWMMHRYIYFKTNSFLPFFSLTLRRSHHHVWVIFFPLSTSPVHWLPWWWLAKRSLKSIPRGQLWSWISLISWQRIILLTFLTSWS